MIISFIRHGEAFSNVENRLSDSGENGLTPRGKGQIIAAAKSLKGNVCAVYASPVQRTIESAELFMKNRPEKLTLVVDKRLREIDYGKMNDQVVGPGLVGLADVAHRQMLGDYDIRFGETGENKREILTRLFEFLLDVVEAHHGSEHAVAFSHGRAISMIFEAVNEAKHMPYRHVSTKNADIRQLVLEPSGSALLKRALKTLTKK